MVPPDANGDAGVLGGLLFLGDFEVQLDFADVGKVVLSGEVLSADVGNAERLVIDEDGEVGFAAVVEHQEWLEALRIGKGEVLVQAGECDRCPVYLRVAGYCCKGQWQLF
jgi:hypothetical protein